MRTPTPPGTRPPGAEPLRRGSLIARTPRVKRLTASGFGRSAVGVLLLGLLAGCAAVPSEGEVLDGQNWSSTRDAAIAEANKVARRVVTSVGLAEVGAQDRTICDHGLNDIWNHDGYGLKCDAKSTSLMGWTGGFVDRATRAEEAIPAECVLSWKREPVEAPTWPQSQKGATYLCEGGVELNLYFVATRSVDVESGFIDAGCVAPNVRCRDPKQIPSEVLRRAREHQWLMEIVATVNLYTEVVR
jgi:hypothetical protein